MFGPRSVMAGSATGSSGRVVRQRGSVLLDERPQSAGAGHDPTSVLPRGGAVHPDVARGGRGVRLDADLEHVCTKHDMTQQHAASSLPAASLRSAIVAERLQRASAGNAPPASSRSLRVPFASWAARLRCRAQRGNGQARTAGAIFPPPRWGRGVGLTHQPAPPLCPRRAVFRRPFSLDDGSPRDRPPSRPSAAAGAQTGPTAHRPPRPYSGPRAPAPPR